MFPEHVSWRSPRPWLASAVVLLLLLVPLLSQWAGSSFYLSFATRIVVFAIAVSGLNLVLGYGGLISLGHALYVGLGAYAVGISAANGLTNGWTQLAIALVFAAAVALVTGLVSLRTRGIGFIMITLAFNQMFFFLAVSLKQYGGDDGLPLDQRSSLAPLPALDNKVTLYYLCLATLLAVMFLVWRLVHSRFGSVLRGFQSNERRMLAAGFPRVRYQLSAYVLSALICTVAGMLQANLTAFAAPSYLSWQASGELILIAVLGGMGTVMGPVVGAVVLLVLEEWLSGLTQHWMVILGLAILLVALVSQRGIWGAVRKWDKRP